MQNDRVMRVLLVIISFLVLLGVLMTAWIYLKKEDQDVIRVHLSSGETETINFESLHLVPGDSCEYVIKLTDDNFPRYDLKLDFVDSAEKETLKTYARVKIIADGAVILDDLLATVLKNDDIILPVDLNAGKNAELKIVYYLPLEVGNEAKNAEAVFKLLLTASNE